MSQEHDWLVIVTPDGRRVVKQCAAEDAGGVIVGGFRSRDEAENWSLTSASASAQGVRKTVTRRK